jgi:hypothetical protein
MLVSLRTLPAIALLLLPVGYLWICLAALLPGICIALGCYLAVLKWVVINSRSFARIHRNTRGVELII